MTLRIHANGFRALRSSAWLAEPRDRAARESQKEPGGERAEFQKPTHKYEN